MRLLNPNHVSNWSTTLGYGFTTFIFLLFLYYARYECMSILACPPISTRFSLVSFVLSGCLILISTNIKSEIDWAMIMMTFFYPNYIAINMRII